MSDIFANCGTVFRFYWWNFAFTLATLVGIGIAAATRLGLHYSRAFWVGMIAVCLFMNMVACEAFLGWEKVRHQTAGSTDSTPGVQAARMCPCLHQLVHPFSDTTTPTCFTCMRPRNVT